MTSEPGKGTIFTLELPFENMPNSDALVPRKLRNLFSSSPSATSKFPLPPASNAPSVRLSKHPNGSTRKLDAMVPTPAGDHLSPRTSTNGHVVGVELRDRAPSPYRPTSEPSSMPDVEHENRASFASMHVLVAEDNFVSQRMLEKRLSQLGYTVVTASDGQEAHDKFVTSSASATKIDVILMDMKVRGNGNTLTGWNKLIVMQMPLVDGSLSARMIRFWEKESQHRPPSDDRQTPTPKQRVPIIAVTSELNEDSRFEYIQSGYVSDTMRQRVDANSVS